MPRAPKTPGPHSSGSDIKTYQCDCERFCKSQLHDVPYGTWRRHAEFRRQPLLNSRLAVPAHNSPALVCSHLHHHAVFSFAVACMARRFPFALTLACIFSFVRGARIIALYFRFLSLAWHTSFHLLSGLAFSRYQYPTHTMLFCTLLDCTLLHCILVLPFCMPATAIYAVPRPPTF